MESDSLKPVGAEIFPSPESATSSRAAGDVSFLELTRILARRKKIMFLALLTALLLSVLYLALATPVYRTEIRLTAPKKQDIERLLTGYRDLKYADQKMYTPDHIFDDFLKNVGSLGVRREFFDDRKLLSHFVSDESDTTVNADRIFQEKFNKQLRIQHSADDRSFVTVSLLYSEPETVATWLNEFIVFANQHTVRQLVIGLQAAIRAEKERVSQQLGSKLKLAESRKRDRIVQLKEALQIAEALGLEGPSAVALTSETSGLPKPTISVNAVDTPLYTRGSKALKLEISVLESRKSDEPFVRGLRDLQERLAYLEGALMDTPEFSAVSVDAPAQVPYDVDKPKAISIVSMAVVLGIALGVLAVFFVEALSKARN